MFYFNFKQAILSHDQAYQILYRHSIYRGTIKGNPVQTKSLLWIADNIPGLDVTDSDRRGREIAVPHFKGTQRIQTLRERSFQVNGARIYNSLPKSIRNLRRLSVVDFKSKLDEYLQTLPDEPKLPNYTPVVCNQITASPSNSIIDHARAKMRRPGQ